jgi:hypothetical protein
MASGEKYERGEIKVNLKLKEKKIYISQEQK